MRFAEALPPPQARKRNILFLGRMPCSLWRSLERRLAGLPPAPHGQPQSVVERARRLDVRSLSVKDLLARTGEVEAFAFYTDRQKEKREPGVTIACTTKEPASVIVKGAR